MQRSSWGRGRACPELAEGFGCLRPKSVRGLPGTQPRVTQRSLVGEARSLPQPAPDAIWGTRSGGEGLPRNHHWGYANVHCARASAQGSPRLTNQSDPLSARQRRSRPFPSHFGHFRSVRASRRVSRGRASARSRSRSPRSAYRSGRSAAGCAAAAHSHHHQGHEDNPHFNWHPSPSTQPPPNPRPASIGSRPLPRSGDSTARREPTESALSASFLAYGRRLRPARLPPPPSSRRPPPEPSVGPPSQTRPSSAQPSIPS